MGHIRLDFLFCFGRLLGRCNELYPSAFYRLCCGRGRLLGLCFVNFIGCILRPFLLVCFLVDFLTAALGCIHGGLCSYQHSQAVMVCV